LICPLQERRIRISARIKKLQDLFPNADKVNISYVWIVDSKFSKIAMTPYYLVVFQSVTFTKTTMAQRNVITLSTNPN